MKILLTGFDPFGNETINPSIEAVKQVREWIDGAQIIKLEVPTVFFESLKVIEKAIIEYDPDVILSIGQAGGRSAITIEKVGINLNDASICDNAGYQPHDESIIKDGENAYFSNLPVKAMVNKIKEAGIPAALSYSAGTFVCNHVLYGVQNMIHSRYPQKKSGFIHIPFMHEQVVNKHNVASMSLDTMVKALEVAIEAIIEDKEIYGEGGEIC